MKREELPLEEVLMRCVRCGTCKAECPTYEEGRNEARSARGRIAILAALMAGTISPSQGAVEEIFSCIQCGACSRTCPAGLDVADAIYAYREQLRPFDRRGDMLRKAVIFGVRHRALACTLARMWPIPITRGFRMKCPPPLDFAVSERHVGIPAAPSAEPVGRAAVFLGCSGRYIVPRLGEALVRVLSRLGYEVMVSDEESCCGIPLLSLGMRRDAQQLARRNLGAFRGIGADVVVSLCPTCIVALRDIYPRIAGEGIGPVTDIASLLFIRGKGLLNEALRIKGFYHDPCHMRYGMGVTQEPREILRRCGVVLESAGYHRCCGFGGTYSVRFPSDSERIGQERVADIEKADAEAVFTSCPGCVMQLTRAGSPAPVYHVIEAIERALV